MSIFIDEMEKQTKRIQEYAQLMLEKYPSKDAQTLRLDCQCLEHQYNVLRSTIPDIVEKTNFGRHLFFMKKDLQGEKPSFYKTDIDDIVNRDLPDILEKLEKLKNDLTITDGELKECIVPLIRQNELDSAIRKAFVVLTERLRKTFNGFEEMDGRDLINNIFGKGTTCTTLDDTTKNAYRSFLEGLYLLFRNQHAHKQKNISIPEEECIISSINWVLIQLETLAPKTNL